MDNHFRVLKKRPVEIRALLVRKENAISVGERIGATNTLIKTDTPFDKKMVFDYVLPSGVVLSVPDGDYIVTGVSDVEFEVWTDRKLWNLYEASDMDV